MYVKEAKKKLNKAHDKFRMHGKYICQPIKEKPTTTAATTTKKLKKKTTKLQ